MGSVPGSHWPTVSETVLENESRRLAASSETESLTAPISRFPVQLPRISNSLSIKQGQIVTWSPHLYFFSDHSGVLRFRTAGSAAAEDPLQ
jgi:hypothetical protein